MFFRLSYIGPGRVDLFGVGQRRFGAKVHGEYWKQSIKVRVIITTNGWVCKGGSWREKGGWGVKRQADRLTGEKELCHRRFGRVDGHAKL